MTASGVAQGRVHDRSLQDGGEVSKRFNWKFRPRLDFRATFKAIGWFGCFVLLIRRR
jgi:hypothetical protein